MKIGDLEPLRERALENARFWGLKYKTIDGSLDLLKKLLFGPYEEKDFFFYQPGEVVSQNPFLELPSSDKAIKELKVFNPLPQRSYYRNNTAYG